MNFLSHDFILPAGSPSIMRIGALLPDLWALLPRRPLPPVVLRTLRASSEPLAGPLADGIESHMRADAVFHGHQEFERRTTEAARALAAAFPGLRYAHLAGHVAVEMLLDRWLIDRDAGLLDRYYAALDPASLDAACRLASSHPEQGAAMRQILERYAGSAFLREYATDRGMVGRWMRSLGRSPFSENGPLDEDRLEALMGQWREGYAPGSESLLEQVRMGVLNWQEAHPPA